MNENERTNEQNALRHCLKRECIFQVLLKDTEFKFIPAAFGQASILQARMQFLIISGIGLCSEALPSLGPPPLPGGCQRCHPSSPLPHQVTLICGPAQAVISGLHLPLASWLPALPVGVRTSGSSEELGWGGCVMSAGVGQRACHAHHFLSLGLLKRATPLDDTQGLSI